MIYRNNFSNACPGSIHALEGVARGIVRNGSSTPGRRNLSIVGADEVLIFIDIALLHDPDESRIEQTKKNLAALPAAWPAGAIEGVLCRGQVSLLPNQDVILEFKLR